MELMPNDHPATVLLAGFGRFPGASVNPAEQLVREFDSASLPGGVRLERLVVPVEWERSWRTLEERIRKLRPDAVLLFGLHSGAPRFRIETMAFDERATDRPDAVGRYAETAAIGSGPKSIETRLPIEALKRSLAQAGIDFELSQDAGRYLCNETLYHLSSNGASLGLRYFGFVHTPLTDECAAEMRRSGEAVLNQELRTVPAAALSLFADRAINCLAEEIRRDAGPQLETAQGNRAFGTYSNA